MEQDVDNSPERTDEVTGTEVTPRTKEAAKVLLAVSKKVTDDTRHDIICSFSGVSETKDNRRQTDIQTTPDSRASPSGQTYVDKLLTIPINNTDETLKYRASLEKDSSDSDLDLNLNKRYPPITVKKWDTYMYLTKKFGNLTGKPNRHGFQITPLSKMTHDSILEYLKENDIEHFYVGPSQDRTIKMVVRGLPIQMSPEEIEDFLRLNLHTDYVQVHQMTKRVYTDTNNRKAGKTKVNMPLFLVKLSDAKAKEKLKKLRHIHFIAISVYDYETSAPDIVQCHRCQNFDHFSIGCNLRPRCVKCAGPHQSSDCKKDRGVTPTCVNCMGPHPANYRGCKVYQKIWQSRFGNGNQQERVSKSNNTTQHLGQHQSTQHSAPPVHTNKHLGHQPPTQNTVTPQHNRYLLPSPQSHLKPNPPSLLLKLPTPNPPPLPNLPKVISPPASRNSTSEHLNVNSPKPQRIKSTRKKIKKQKTQVEDNYSSSDTDSCSENISIPEKHKRPSTTYKDIYDKLDGLATQTTDQSEVHIVLLHLSDFIDSLIKWIVNTIQTRSQSTQTDTRSTGL